jgi:hypothetical protein
MSVVSTGLEDPVPFPIVPDSGHEPLKGGVALRLRGAPGDQGLLPTG